MLDSMPTGWDCSSVGDGQELCVRYRVSGSSCRIVVLVWAADFLAVEPVGFVLDCGDGVLVGRPVPKSRF